MYRQIEERSSTRGDTRLWVHASLMAQPAFAAMGFEIIRNEEVQIGPESLSRAEMQKILSAA